MNARTILLPAAVLLACAPVVDVQTDPIDQSIPVTSVGLQSYVELAFDLPPQSQGDVQLDHITADLEVHNGSRATDMLLELRVSFTGTATPQTPFAFTALNRPSYYSSSVALLPPKTYPAASTTQEHVLGDQLIPAVLKPRLWLIVSNTVTNLNLGDTLPLQLDLKQIVLKAEVTKSLAGAGGGLETTGM